MLSFLAMIRDVLVALALAWVGVTLEARQTVDDCRGDACRAESSN
jgi:hypothetical protein